MYIFLFISIYLSCVFPTFCYLTYLLSEAILREAIKYEDLIVQMKLSTKNRNKQIIYHLPNYFYNGCEDCHTNQDVNSREDHVGAAILHDDNIDALSDIMETFLTFIKTGNNITEANGGHCNETKISVKKGDVFIETEEEGTNTQETYEN